MSSKIQLRRDSAANWTATNPVLAQGEPGLETDTSKVKYGDGSTAWNLLDYASGGSSGGGDFSTGFEDGVNENTYHFVTVQGKKEFTFETEGHKHFEITLTAPMLADFNTNSNLTFTTTDTPEMADVWLNYSFPRGNSVYFYLKQDWDQNNLSSWFNSMSQPLVGTFQVNVSAPVPLTAGDKIVVMYWQEGTTYTGSNYDNYGNYVPDVSESTATNTVTLSNGEFYNWLGNGDPGTALADLLDPNYASKHALSFVQNEVNDQRNITNVVNNNDGTITITFDGTAVQSKTSSTATFSFSAPDSRNNDAWFTIPVSAYPNLLKEIRSPYGSSTYKYTGGQQRSGYLTINGGQAIDFFWWGNDINASQWQVYLPAGGQTYTQGDTIEVTFYKFETEIELQIYRPGNAQNNWNNGYKWFDWKDDIATEYSPGEGNGIMGGNGQILMVTFRQPVGTWSQDQRSMVVQFGWTGMGNYEQSPRDPYRQSNVSDWGYDNDSSYPLYVFDERGIVFWNNRTYWQNNQSVTYKVRIIYKFNLIIGGEDNYNWFYC